MVGDDGVDGAVDHAGDKGLGIGSRAQRRVDLEGRGVIVADVVLGEEQVMRGDLAGDRQALGFRGANHIKAARSGDVLDVQLAAGKAAQGDVASDLQLLAFGRPTQKAQARRGDALIDLAIADQVLVLAVAHDHAAELAGVIHDAAHHAGGLDTAAVIGERDGAVCGHVAHLGERLALQALRAGTRHVHATLAGLGGDGLHILDGDGVVDDRVGVGHGANSREAAMGCGAGAAGDVFLLLEARLAQMHMHIHQARDDDLAGQVALDALLQGKALADLDDLAVADEDVGGFVQTDLRVDHVRVLKQ